jgi:post-segregation antitoxin (ccd killing protein)
MVLAQPIPVTTEVASELASHWVTLMAFGRRMAAGDSLLDPETITDLMKYRIRQEVVGEWRRRLLAPLPPAAGPEFDSSYARDLLRTRHTRLSADAPALFREIATAPWRSPASTRVLATFDGGTIAASQLQHYVQYLSPATRLDIQAAPDDRITRFLWGFLLDELLVAQAESAGVRVSETAYQAMADECRELVHTLWERADLSPASLAAAGATADDRAQAAAHRVEAYLEAAVARKVPLEPLPPFLAVPLLRDVEWEIAADRMSAVVDRARRLLTAAESPRRP